MNCAASISQSFFFKYLMLFLESVLCLVGYQSEIRLSVSVFPHVSASLLQAGLAFMNPPLSQSKVIK